MRKIRRNKQAECPTCEAVVSIGPEPVLEQRFSCTKCGETLKIINLTPLTLEWAWEDLLEDAESLARSRRSLGLR